MGTLQQFPLQHIPRDVCNAFRLVLQQLTVRMEGRWGMCAQLEQVSKLYAPLLIRHMQQWPEYSGHPEYPVPAPSGRAYSAYIHTPDKWGPHAYGDKRRELALWLLSEIEGRLL